MFGKLEMGNPVLFGNMLVIPLIGDDQVLKVIDLETGKSMGVLVEEKGVVDTVTVRNSTDEDVFIMDGEEFIGAWQDRIAMYSYVISSGETKDIKVLCIERGRWDKDNKNKVFASGFTAFPRLREFLTFCGNNPSGIVQEKVWTLVETKLKTLSVESKTGSLHHSYGAVDSYISMCEDWKPEDGTIGIMAFTNRGFLCADIFGSSELFRKLYKKVIAGYALDAVEDRIKGRVFEFSMDKVISVFKTILNLQPKHRYSESEFSETILFDGKLKGKSLIYRDSFVHGTFFPR